MLSKIRQQLRDHPCIQQQFCQHVQHTLNHYACPNQCLQEAWHHVAPKTTTAQPRQCVQTPNLKEYWQLKQQYRQALAQCDQYSAPVMYHIATCRAAHIRQYFPTCTRRLAPILRAWRSALTYQRADKALKKKVRLSKQQQFEDLLANAQAAAKQGLPAIYKLVKQQAPKSSKRSIHFRSPEGQLMSPLQEIQELETYFKNLYHSHLACTPPAQWWLEQAMDITTAEVQAALQSLPAGKALPKGDAPAALWKSATDILIEPLTAHLNKHLQPGPLSFPQRWHESHLVLIPKPNKPPNCPAHLRPISLLPAEAKLLAKIAAERLRPWTQQALANLPQFAYSAHRQTADAIDRVLSHCAEIRQTVALNRRSIHKNFSGQGYARVAGGLQLSLDLTKAYDYLPRHLLLAALQRIGVPGDLQRLIMYIHDNALLVLTKHSHQASVRMASDKGAAYPCNCG